MGFDMIKTRITLAHLPPSVNHAYSHTRTGVRRSDAYRTWLQGEGHSVNRQLAGQTKFDGPVFITLAMKRPRSNADLDNRIKPIFDLLQAHGIISNDKHVHGLHVWWDQHLPEGICAEIYVRDAE
jgi:Holliday junction resolvase RusA-like endonuclease